MGRSEWAKRKNRELRRRALEDRDASLWHSGAYHRYFEGYTERQIVGPDGKARLTRVYTGVWYRQKLDRKSYILVRLLYLALLLLMAGAMILASRSQGGAGTAFYVVLPELATLCLLLYLAYILLTGYLFMPRKLTVYGYKSSTGALKRTARFLLVVYLADAAMSLAEWLLHLSENRFESFPVTMAAFLAGAAMAAAMEGIERRIVYEEEENPDSGKAAGGVTIDDERSRGIRE